MIQSDFEFTIHFNSQNAHSLYHLASRYNDKGYFFREHCLLYISYPFSPALIGSFFSSVRVQTDKIFIHAKLRATLEAAEDQKIECGF